MKKLIILLLANLISCFAFAQKLTKEEERALKNELKKLSVEQWKSQKDEEKLLSEQVKNKNQQFKLKDNELNDLNTQVQLKETRMEQLNSELSTLSRKLMSGNDVVTSEGAFFRVQIGAYQNKKIAKFLKKYNNFEIEEGENGMKRYLVGSFKSYWEAKNLSEKLTDRGAQAFVVGYLDGARVPNLKQMPEKYIK